MKEPDISRARRCPGLPRAFVRHPWRCLGITLLLIIPLCFSLLSVRFHSSTDILLEGDQRSQEVFEMLREYLHTRTLVIAVVHHPRLFSDEGASLLRGVGGALSWVRGVYHIESPAHTLRPRRDGFSLDWVPFVPPPGASAAAWEQAKAIAISHPLTRNVLASESGDHAMVLAVCDRPLPTLAARRTFTADIEKAVAPYNTPEHPVHTLSLPQIEVTILDMVQRDVIRFAPAVGAVLLLILAVTFRSWRICMAILLVEALVLLLLPAAVTAYDAVMSSSAGTTQKLLAGNAGSINLYTSILFPLAAAIQLTFLIHLMAAFQRVRSQGVTGSDAMEQAVGEVIRPSTLGAITTGLGLLSLLACDVAPVRDVGVLGAAAMVAILVITFGPALSIITLMCARGPVRTRHTPASSRLPHRLPRRRVVVPVAVVLAMLAVPGILRVRTDIRAVEFLDAHSPLRQLVERVDTHFGGISMLQLDIDSGTPGGVTRKTFLRYLEKVRRYATHTAGISTAHTYSELFCLMNQVWQGEAPGSYRLPDSGTLFALFSMLLDNSDLLAVRYLADDARRVAHVYLRTRNMPSDTYIALLNTVVAYAQEHKPDGVTVREQEGLHTLLEADLRIIRSQGRSLGWSIASIFIFLCLLWRNLRHALLALISAALPVVIMFGIIGYSAIYLNSVTIMVAAVVLGIGVDDAIHFIAYYRSERDRADSARDALMRTLVAKRRPIICTSLILSSSLLLFLIFSFPPVRHFGILAAAALLLEMTSVLLLIPAVIKRKAT